MSRKRLGAIDRDSVASLRSAAEEAAAERRIGAELKAPPIAQVARTAASALEDELLQLRRENGGLREAGAAWAEAEAEGRVILRVGLDEIDAHSMTRDRRVLDRDSEDWQALKTSLYARGQQVPVELAERAAGTGKFGLISGYRRVSCLRDLFEETGERRFAEVLAILRPSRESLEKMLAMVEENEIRQDVSFYERGRLCCLAAEQGICATVDEAIEALFPNSSRNRRYKIRNFTVLHQRLGSLLDFPEAIGERLGAKLAQAIKDDRDAALVKALSDRGERFADAAEELALLKAFAARRPPFAEPKPAPARQTANWRDETGLRIAAQLAGGTLTLKIEGSGLDDAADLAALLNRLGPAIRAT